MPLACWPTLTDPAIASVCRLTTSTLPGAEPTPSLDTKATTGPAIERLHASMRAFLKWTGPLRPHFAYGELAKPEYELAHAMHLANHLSAFRVET